MFEKFKEILESPLHEINPYSTAFKREKKRCEKMLLGMSKKEREERLKKEELLEYFQDTLNHS